MIYKNKKTGTLYRYLATAANESNNEMVVVYCPCDDEHSVYVRDEAEFYEKFELYTGTKEYRADLLFIAGILDKNGDYNKDNFPEAYENSKK